MAVPMVADTGAPPGPLGVPVVSAIMAAYNSARHVPAAVEGVLAQTLGNWELIVVDDRSADATAKAVERFDDPRITLIRLERNVGRAGARNAALAVARGRYIAVCDSDDVSLPTRFERQVEVFERRPEVGVVASQVAYFSGDGDPEVRVVYPQEPEAIQRRMRRGKSAVPHQAAMIRAELFQRHGGYAVECRRCQDFELFLRAADETSFVTLAEPLVLYRQDARAVPLSYWLENAAYQRYAGYRARMTRQRRPPDPFARFARHPRVRLALASVELASYARFRIRQRGQAPLRLH